MAKLTVTVAFFLFVLALAQARIPLDQKENDVITEDLSTDVLESDPKNTATWARSILLPSHKDSEIETNAKPETSKSEKPEAVTNDFVPLTVINFHPINRHFRQPSFTLRHRRPCHHHRLAKPWGLSRFEHREVSYGNDMLVSEGDGKEEVREITPKWSKFPDGDAHLIHFRRDDDVRREGFARPHHHHLHAFHRSHMAEGEKERAGHEQEEQTGFMTKIRKFLNHF